jgi:hypothetical protein
MEEAGAMMAPAAEARMAQSPSFSRSYSNPASRLAYERPLLLVLAVAAIFAFYVLGGHYSFVRPLEGVAPGIIEGPSGFAATSSSTYSAETGELRDSGVTSTGEAGLVADTSANLQQAASATTTQPLVEPAAHPQTVAVAADRWATAGIVLISEGQEWDETTLTNVDQALSTLPADVLAQLGNPELGPLHILVNTEGRSMNGSQPYGGAANYFSTNDGINELVLYPGQRVATVLHELGHAYNLRRTPAGHYAHVLVDPEMESFLAATGWRVLTPRETVAQALDHTQIAFDYTGTFVWPEVSHFDPLEDFANSFAAYYYDPAGLKDTSPERYDWMAAHLPN